MKNLKTFESFLNEGTLDQGEIAIYIGNEGTTHIFKQGKGYYGYNDEFDFVAKDKKDLEKKLKSWRYELLAGSIDESEVNEGAYRHMPELIELLSDIDAMEMDPEEFIDQMVQYYDLDADTAGDLFDAYWSLGAKDRFHFEEKDWEKFLKKHGIK